jgi:hypothetical protein
MTLSDLQNFWINDLNLGIEWQIVVSDDRLTGKQLSLMGEKAMEVILSEIVDRDVGQRLV